MRVEDLDFAPTTTKLRQFGFLLVFFGTLAAIVSQAKGSPGLIWLIVPIAFGACGLIGIIVPGFLRWPFVLWTLAVFPIGWSISQIILLGIFFLVFMPIGLIFRLIRRDALQLKDSKQSTFWNPAPAKSDPNRYFRQY